MTYSHRTMAWFQNNFTEMFLRCASTKIAKMVLLPSTKWPPELKIEKHLNNILPRPMVWFQNYFIEICLGWPFTRIAKTVLLRWTKWPPELKIEKVFKQHLFIGQLFDFKIILQKCSLGNPLPKLLKWLPLETPLISISHSLMPSLSWLILTDLLSSGERSRAIMALLFRFFCNFS